MIIDSRKIDYPSWVPEEYLCIDKVDQGFELSIKVHLEIEDFNENDYKDLTEYDEDGLLKDGYEYDYELQKFINGIEVSHFEIDWNSDDLIILGKEMVYSEVLGGYKPLIIKDFKGIDEILKNWIQENGLEFENKNNSSFSLKLVDIIKTIKEFIQK